MNPPDNSLFRSGHLLLLGLILVAGLGTLALSTGLLTRLPPADADPADSGYSASDFALERLSRETFRLSEHRGKVVLLNFWATWCPPCREEIPDLIRLQEEMSGDLLVVGISLDEKGRKVVEPFAKEYSINYPVLIDDGRAVDKYGPISGIPTSFFIDRNGRVRLVAAGMVTEEQLRPVLTALIDGTVPDSLEPPFRPPPPSLRAH